MEYPFPYFCASGKVDDKYSLEDLEIMANFRYNKEEFVEDMIQSGMANKIGIETDEKILNILNNRGNYLGRKKRQSLLDKAKDNKCMEWWSYIYNCETQALFLT